jgi:hypothetical protein
LKLEKKADINITVTKCDITVWLEKMAENIGYNLHINNWMQGRSDRGMCVHVNYCLIPHRKFSIVKNVLLNLVKCLEKIIP